MVTRIEFSEILPIWSNDLWPNRISKIESHSAMLFDGSYSMLNFDYTASYFCFEIEGTIAGVNSGHACSDGSYRSRGLFVYPEFRNKGIGRALLMAAIDQARFENAKFVWSFPRQNSWKVYESAGFSLASGWFDDEMGVNAYCKVNLIQ